MDNTPIILMGNNQKEYICMFDIKICPSKFLILMLNKGCLLHVLRALSPLVFALFRRVPQCCSCVIILGV